MMHLNRGIAQRGFMKSWLKIASQDCALTRKIVFIVKRVILKTQAKTLFGQHPKVVVGLDIPRCRGYIRI